MKYLGKIQDAKDMVNKEYVDGKLDNVATNFVDGSTTGSVKSIGAAAEGAGYTMGQYAFAEGKNAKASGNYSHAEGMGTTTQSQSQHVQGEYNIEDTAGSATARGTYAHIVGNGTAEGARSNAHTLDWSGNAWFAGNVKVGGTSAEDGAVVATQDWAAQAEHTHSEYAEKANASGGFAGGTGASATDGGAVGENANATVGGAVGWNASATTGGAIGNATVTQNGGAVGFAACTSDGFAGGNQAMAVDDLYNPIDAIQLGTGTNRTAKTLKVYSYQLMDASGKIPVGRIPTIPIANGGTGVSSMVGTDYTTNRPRGIILQSSTPTSVSNGCIVGVYE